MTDPTPRPNLSPDAVAGLRWIAAGRPEPAPLVKLSVLAWVVILEELEQAGMIARYSLTNAGRAEVARLEEAEKAPGGGFMPEPSPTIADLAFAVAALPAAERDTLLATVARIVAAGEKEPSDG